MKTGRLIQRHLQDRLAAGAVIALLASAVFVPDAVAGSVRASAPVTGATAPAGTKPAIQEAYGRLPLTFRPNRGQADSAIAFTAASGPNTLALSGSGVSVSLSRDTTAGQKPGVDLLGDAKLRTIRAEGGQAPATLGVRFLGGNANATGTGAAPVPGVANYILGRDPAGWRLGVPGFSSVVFHDVYPGIDVVYRSVGQDLEYDFVVAPGASTAPIAMTFVGAKHIARGASGEIVLTIDGGQVVQNAPVAYQASGKSRSPVTAEYVANANGTFGLKLGDYDHTRALTVDPLLVFSTFLGGTGYDAAYSIAIDGAGNSYVAGLTGSTDFPGAGVPAKGAGHVHAFVSKLNPAGSALVYSTYVGGSSDDEALGIAVDSSGAAYVTGATVSADFPLVASAYSTYGGGADAFAFKLNAVGSALSYSSYLGGTGYDIGYGVAVDSTGSAYVSGLTSSADFPLLGGLGIAAAGGAKAFITKFGAAGAVAYSTFLGAASGDAGASAIVVDAAGDAYVTGITTSAAFPVVTPLQGGPGGNGDGFVSKLNAAGSALLFSTYLGGGGFDEGLALALDQSNDVFVAGVTTSANFPTTRPWQTANAGGVDAFVAKIDKSGAALAYSTYLGGSGTDIAYGIGVDWSGYVYVTGSTDSANFPSIYANQAYGGSGDGFLTMLSPGGSVVIYSTYIGGSAADQSRAIAVDPFGNVYVAGITNSANFPTQVAVQAANMGNSDGFVVKLAGVIPPSWWTTYLSDHSHTGANTTQQLLNPGTAPLAHLLWELKTPGIVTAEPIVGNGLIYFGSWDGYERAVDPSGHVVWATYLGVTIQNAVGCLGGNVGIVNIGSLITVGASSVLYIGGGDAAQYALNATTGAVIWRTSLGVPPNQFLWASPVYFNGSVYEGVGSFQECPAVQGQLVQMDAATGAIQHVFKTVPDGCTGAPVLSTIAVDEAEGVIYDTTGNSPDTTCAGSLPIGILKLRASDLTLLDYWLVPPAEYVVSDPDFGASPMLFNTTINGVAVAMVGVLDKNGTYYAFDRHAIGAGPVWRASIGVAGNCPVCGTGAPISPSAYDGKTIYVGSNTTTINGVTCNGSVRALNPVNGAFLWQKCLSYPVLGAISTSQGVLTAGAGPDLYIMSAVDGSTLATFHDPNPPLFPLTGTAKFWGGAAIAQGVVYIGNVDGSLFAVGL